MRHLVREAGLEGQIVIDSAGTAGYHTGDAPDARARAAGARRGIEVGGAARQFQRGDFERFDYVIAMDRSNAEDLRELAPNAAAREKIHLLRSFDPLAPPGAHVPDPYYGGDDGFDHVLDLCVAGCRALLERIRHEHAL
jgi:protein-tyrosine phosphatase